MQEIIYDEAPYHVLYYPSQLDAYRTDRFGGWKNQPSQNGDPLFGFGPLDYTYLTDANAPAPSPSASAAASSSTAARPRRRSRRPRRRPRRRHPAPGRPTRAAAIRRSC